MTQRGPFDLRNIQCYTPDGCCLLMPDKIKLDDLLCTVRAMLPEGEMWNCTDGGPFEPPSPPLPEPPELGPGVGCQPVGCMPLCGGVIDEPPCTEHPERTQIDIVDSFSAVVHQVLQALAVMLRELDPCTATHTVDCWLARYGITFGPCDPQWSLATKQLLLCMAAKLSHGYIFNRHTLNSVASYFGVKAHVHSSGDFNCGPMPGFWTLGRDRNQFSLTGCAPLTYCTDTGTLPPPNPAFLVFNPPCKDLPSIDIIICKGETTIPDNCLLPGEGNITVTPSDELYQAFQFLLGRMISAGTDVCVYTCEDFPCEDWDAPINPSPPLMIGVQ